MQKKLVNIIFGLILAPVLPLVAFLLGWWAAYTFFPEKWMPLVTLFCLGFGILADLLWLKQLIRQARTFNWLFWAAVFLFYSMGIFGMFMGVPLGNALLAVPAGCIVAARLVEAGDGGSRVRWVSTRTAWFTTGVLVLICAASAFIALASSSTASDLQGMLGLGFEVTRGMIVALILVGGAGLLVFNWLLTFAASTLVYKLLQRGT